MNEDLMFIAMIRANALTELTRAKYLRGYSLSLDSQKEANICESVSKELDTVANNMIKSLRGKK